MQSNVRERRSVPPQASTFVYHNHASHHRRRPLHPDGLARLQSAPGVTFEHPGNAPAGTLAERLRYADGLIVRGTPVDEALLKGALQTRGGAAP
jgi:phosphoglycerate dehydrogenase-like enzyme